MFAADERSYRQRQSSAAVLDSIDGLVLGLGCCSAAVWTEIAALVQDLEERFHRDGPRPEHKSRPRQVLQVFSFDSFEPV